MSVGATAVNNLDRLPARTFDERAVWGNTNPDTGNVFSIRVGEGAACDAGFAVTESNAGPRSRWRRRGGHPDAAADQPGRPAVRVA